MENRIMMPSQVTPPQMRVVFGWVVFLGITSPVLSKPEVSSPLVVGYVTGGHAYAVELRKQGRKDRYGNLDIFLVRASLESQADKRHVDRFHISHLIYRNRFLPWHFAFGSFWFSEGQNGTGPW